MSMRRKAGRQGSLDAIKLWTPDELAEMLQVTRVTVLRQAKKGEIPSIKFGKSVRFHPEDVRTWIAGNKNQR
jgi:excisionase family DNA binding protein